MTRVSCAHTPAPAAYLAWVEWAETMRRTHRQVRCPGCGLWKVWEPRPPAATKTAVAKALQTLAR